MLGYKTRRILKSHKLVCSIRQEYSDLLTFAEGLKQELAALRDKHPKQQQQIKQLLAQSVKDLRQKRHQLWQTFNDVFTQSLRSVNKQGAGYYYEKVDWLHQSKGYLPASHPHREPNEAA